MRRFVLLIILICAAGKYGWDYLLSPDFQAYGDRHKAQWTCRVNNTFGGFFEIASEYQTALGLYEHTLARCPDTPMAEVALFHRAACLEGVIRPMEAIATYQAYLDKYPDGEKRPTAVRAIDRIRLSR